jgi:zinc protease
MLVPTLRTLLLTLVGLLAAAGAVAQKSGAEAASEPASASVRPALALSLQKAKLQSGLRVVMNVNRAVASVAVCVTYDVGDRDELPGQCGFAHLLEQIMLSPDRLVTVAHSRGGAVWSRTSVDHTTFCSTVPSGELRLAIWLEAQRLKSTRVDQAALRAYQRRAAVASRGQSLAGSSSAGRYRLLGLALQGYRHYEPDPGAAIEELTAASVAGLQGFFHSHYRPERAVMTIVGDFDTDVAMHLVRDEWGQVVGSGAAASFVEPPLPRQTSERFLAFEHRQGDTPILYVGWAIPAPRTPEHRALRLAAAVLGGGEGSLLHRALMSTRGWARQVQVWTGQARGADVFGVEVVLTRQATVKNIEREIGAELRRLRYAGPTKRQLEAARTWLASRLLLQLQTNSQRARLLGEYELLGGDARLLPREFDAYAAVTPAAVREAIAEHLTDDQRSVVAAFPPGWGRGASGQTLPVFHIVHSGENLTGIAKRYSVTVAELATLNRINPKQPIFPGQKLRLPTHARKPKQARPERSTRSAPAGQARTGIAGAQRRTAQATPSGKPKSNSRPSKPAAVDGSKQPQASKAAARPTRDESQSQVTPRVHVVRKYQTLLGIARRYGVSLRALLEANGLSSKTPIVPGQRLRIPPAQR